MAVDSETLLQLPQLKTISEMCTAIFFTLYFFPLLFWSDFLFSLCIIHSFILRLLSQSLSSLLKMLSALPQLLANSFDSF